MSQAAPIYFYEPERLGDVWTVKQQASRTRFVLPPNQPSSACPPDLVQSH